MIVRAVASAYTYISNLRKLKRNCKPLTYGGIVRSCASAALKPRSLMIDGYKKQLVTWPCIIEAVISYQKHAQSVKRQGKRVEASAVQPDFGVLHRARNILPRDTLIGHSITIHGKTSSDKLFLFRSDKCGLGWPIHHVPVGGKSKHDGENSLNDEDPSTPWSVFTLQALVNEVTYLHPLRPATPLMWPMPHARMPPKAPAMDAAEKNKATRYWRSERLYHCKMHISFQAQPAQDEPEFLTIER